ncbi:hypothetical protein [Paraburkholderia rhizosphaerae]|uniref:Uncharacterized protein n=1 Tax=Paraburkholderia rhizosphaerae TaxID=480658 RepID=A0A4V3HEG1_9BURK|nr:hypothetical protein [Paraburkholderia rhizosphaerae]TDY47669.1 hypothetical protein BX592_11254 [Paraburkholderia rhizosphaerae]
MDLSFALRFFIVMLTLICIAIIALAVSLADPFSASARRALALHPERRRDGRLPEHRHAHQHAHQHPNLLAAGIAALPRARWPGVLTGAGVAFLLVSFALLAAAGCVAG